MDGYPPIKSSEPSFHRPSTNQIPHTDLSSSLSEQRQKRKRARSKVFVLPPRKAPRTDRSQNGDAAFNYGEDVDYLRHDSLPKFLRGSSIPGVMGAEGGDKVGGNGDESDSVDGDEVELDEHSNEDNDGAMDVEGGAQSDGGEEVRSEEAVTRPLEAAKDRQSSSGAGIQEITRAPTRKRVSAL